MIGPTAWSLQGRNEGVLDNKRPRSETEDQRTIMQADNSTEPHAAALLKKQESSHGSGRPLKKFLSSVAIVPFPRPGEFVHGQYSLVTSI